ncbi:hypothetical protein AMIS_19770 [Actinoplanes missouriensis 431]|uniref:Uncharacterized protein n=1 Tax=Actinoplanes missouriensis (strain ATCC 14538 / DSM 43046 / CBS 188.64 / JCM 3121 / NBRC 102363 / NCIMB 12654 / NRRL B-3342 / UNCC 431) TaxID=512565 RepID=I0H2G0_ACTM4|nr:hypothetical protein [Actinoplanes missouriensis]BAL87197.1 hypothetical protein AMIS_19770 [Actinoplanes missouriensis 431]
MSIATFRYYRDGKPGFTGYDTTNLTAQQYADRKAARTNPDYADQVHVWFGYADESSPDAVAEVPA